MKALLILRHADSGDKRSGQTDWDRDLTSKGIKQSAAIAEFMQQKELAPEEVIASNATRVRLTLEFIAQNLGPIPAIIYTRDLYETDINGHLKAVRNAPPCQTLLLAGHNPGISSFASFVSKTKVGGMGTGDLLVFHFKEDSWAKLNRGECELMEHFSPSA